MEINLTVIVVVAIVVLVGTIIILINKRKGKQEIRQVDQKEFVPPEALPEPTPMMNVPPEAAPQKADHIEPKTMEMPTDLESPELGDENFVEPDSPEPEEEPEIEVVDDINYTRPRISLEADFVRQKPEVKKKKVDDVLGEIDVLVNDEKVSTHKITGREIKIGRDPSQSHIIIPELIVSKLHCTLIIKEGRIFIKDNESTNGLYIGDEKVTEQEMIKDTVIFLGRKGTVKILFRKT
jgi:hypothetical protein